MYSLRRFAMNFNHIHAKGLVGDEAGSHEQRDGLGEGGTYIDAENLEPSATELVYSKEDSAETPSSKY